MTELNGRDTRWQGPTSAPILFPVTEEDPILEQFLVAALRQMYLVFGGASETWKKRIVDILYGVKTPILVDLIHHDLSGESSLSFLT